MKDHSRKNFFWGKGVTAPLIYTKIEKERRGGRPVRGKTRFSKHDIRGRVTE